MAGIVRNVPTPGTVAQLPGTVGLQMTNPNSLCQWGWLGKEEERRRKRKFKPFYKLVGFFYWAQTHDTRARARWG